MKKNLKEVLGFTKGYVTIFQGDIEAYDEWFRKSNARYCRLWGWYVISTETVPEDLPNDISQIKLFWNEISIDNETIKSESEVKYIVNNKLFTPSISNFVGAIGQRLELTLEVVKSIPLGNAYGKPTIMHILHDKNENEFIWITSARNWPVGTVKNLRGTVKDHSIYKNCKQTILTRCMEVKK